MSFRLLIADDETLIRRDLRELLTDLGYAVVAEAKDGAEAQALAARHKPDVVILDIVMKDGAPDGLDAARALGAEYPVIMLTAHSSTDLVLAARDAGVMGYLTKPFRQKDLGPAIELAVTHFLRTSQLAGKVKVLTEQLETRKLVDRAKGVLMTVGKLSEAEAYRQIQKLSMERNLSMRRVAEVILSGNEA